MGKIVGIDLGTTNSLISVWEDGQSKLIPNSFGEYLTPSVVSFDGDKIYVGKIAKERLYTYPQQTFSAFKRYMGMDKTYGVGTKTYSPEELSGFVLRRLKEDAQNYLGEKVEDAVISVPAYFNDMARSATKRAGKLAGLNVERIVNEPSAAALACRFQNDSDDFKMMVFDFGGGTLDVSLVDCFENIIEIIGVSGDNYLGGRDFDDALLHLFLEKTHLNVSDLNEKTVAALRFSAEQCKMELSERKETKMVVKSQQIDKEIVITRKEFAYYCGSLFDRISIPIKRVLADAKMNTAQIDKVVLVGGSCKMPIIKQFLEHLLDKNGIEIINPDYMIARGIGIYAGIMERNEEIKDVLLTDICPFSLGVEVANHMLGDKRPLTSVVIERNSPLPRSVVQEYYNAGNNQTEVRFAILQGESMYSDENILLGILKIKIPASAAGETKCLVRFTYDINGILEIDVDIPSTGEKYQKVIVNKRLEMSQDEIDSKIAEYAKIKWNQAEEEENQYIFTYGERLYQQADEETREEIKNRLMYFDTVIAKDPYRVKQVRKYLTVYFSVLEKSLHSYIDSEDEKGSVMDWYKEDWDDEEEKNYQEWEDDNL